MAHRVLSSAGPRQRGLAGSHHMAREQTDVCLPGAEVHILLVADLEGVLQARALVPYPVRKGMQRWVPLRLKQATSLGLP